MHMWQECMCFGARVGCEWQTVISLDTYLEITQNTASFCYWLLLCKFVYQDTVRLVRLQFDLPWQWIPCGHLHLQYHSLSIQVRDVCSIYQNIDSCGGKDFFLNVPVGRKGGWDHLLKDKAIGHADKKISLLCVLCCLNGPVISSS